MPASEPNPDDWHIELRRLPLLHRGHAVLVLRGPNGEEEELNGMAESRNIQRKLRPLGFDGDKLVVANARFGEKAEPVAKLASGSYAEMSRIWQRGLRAGDEINAKDYDYKGHDPSYELSTDGGQIQNSNSVAYTLSRAMGLDADAALRAAGRERTFSGWGRNLLDPDYDERRYRVPPVFPAQNAP